jgi:hypothetical protein
MPATCRVGSFLSIAFPFPFYGLHRVESVCHSMAISAHATFIAGSVASSARRSQANALSRYLSERLLFISTLRWWGGSITLSVTGNSQ